jgi:hypothetical protein
MGRFVRYHSVTVTSKSLQLRFHKYIFLAMEVGLLKTISRNIKERQKSQTVLSTRKIILQVLNLDDIKPKQLIRYEPNIVVEWLASLVCIWKVPGSSLGTVTG